MIPAEPLVGQLGANLLVDDTFENFSVLVNEIRVIALPCLLSMIENGTEIGYRAFCLSDFGFDPHTMSF